MPYLDNEDRIWKSYDPISSKNPAHYRRHRVDLYNITKNHNFSRGNVIRYVDRAGHKPEGDIYKELEDLEKAQWYLNAEIEELRLKIYDSVENSTDPATQEEYVDPPAKDPGDELVVENNDPELRLRTEETKLDNLPVRTVDESHDF